MMRALKSLTVVLTTALVCACGGESAEANAPAEEASAGGSSGAAAAAPSAVELEQGIGPIRDLELAPVDPALAEEGETAFSIKCSACHKLEERFVAPPLGDVLSRRRPEFVMNMILNANEMVQRHPEVQALLAEYFTPMPVQVTDQAEARAILEYLRSAQVSPDQVSHQ
ncbi:MAG: cytochrome c [Longimicrobiales bacterium]|nr:cytochrome c [Longimicrobiales bacterium]